jgi:alkanesulfonate monooxygenase SsuD/methylene tetrahydromethanopterin reductase-like flavin-dependent oxidoreductase (luciferase family)
VTRWGVTVPLPNLPLREHADLVRRVEAAGYTDLWSGETNGPDGFTPLAACAAWTERVRLGTGVVGAFTRGPALLAQQAAALADLSGGRFALGIGASSDRIVEGWNGMPFDRPLTRIAQTVDFLDAAFAGERTATGFKLEQPPPESPPVILAALRGKMLRLAVEGCRRVHQLPAAGGAAARCRAARRGTRGIRAPVPVLLPAGRAG